MNIRYPFNILTTELANDLQKIAVLLGASSVQNAKQGHKIEDVYFIGPYNLIKDLIASQNNYEKKSLRIIVNKNILAENNDKGQQKILANGIYLPPTYTSGLPFLMIYRRVKALDNKPILISENYVRAGELVIVPESSEYFAVLFYNDGIQCKIPEEVQWFSWISEEDAPDYSENRDLNYDINYRHYSESEYVDGKKVELEEPLLEILEYNTQLIDSNNPTIQVFPIITDTELEELLEALKSCKAWVRRTGENNILYTQETFDILQYSSKEDAPIIFKKLIEKVQKESLISNISKLSGIKLTALRELYAFRMQSNEFITKHADSTLNGQLLVRFNWLLQSPTGRKHDLRFWQGKNSEKPIARFEAIPNSATIFFVGDATPHDLSPLPENSDKDRFNIVLTFGHNID